MQELGIGELAKRGGVRIDTVRYYELSGLLTPHTRSSSGYRRYRDVEVARLRFIRRAQALGFTLTRSDRCSNFLLSAMSLRPIAPVWRLRANILSRVQSSKVPGRARSHPAR